MLSGGTSTYTNVYDPVSIKVCESATGVVRLAPKLPPPFDEIDLRHESAIITCFFQLRRSLSTLKLASMSRGARKAGQNFE